MINPLSLTTTFASLEALSAISGKDPADKEIMIDNATWTIVFEGVLAQLQGSPILPQQSLYDELASAIAAEFAMNMLHGKKLTVGDGVLRFMSVNIAKSLI